MNRMSSVDLVAYAIFTKAYNNAEWLNKLKELDKQAYYFLKNNYVKGKN